MKSFLLGEQEISCESSKKGKQQKIFMPSQLQKCMEKVQLKYFLSNLLLLLPFPCLTHCTVQECMEKVQLKSFLSNLLLLLSFSCLTHCRAGHSTDMAMLEQDDPLSLLSGRTAVCTAAASKK